MSGGPVHITRDIVVSGGEVDDLKVEVLIVAALLLGVGVLVGMLIGIFIAFVLATKGAA